MKAMPTRQEFLWMTTGALLLLGVILVILAVKGYVNPTERLEARKHKGELIMAMLAALATADEAEKSAVLSTDDEESKKFAQRSKDAALAVTQKGTQFSDLLKRFGSPDENALYQQFTGEFQQYQKINDELLSLAVRNTNVKAYAILYGPADQLFNEIRQMLADSANFDVNKMALPSLHAQIDLLDIKATLPQHIREQDDKKMTEMEKQILADEEDLKSNLDTLLSLAGNKNADTIKKTQSAFTELQGLRSAIIDLSRENTNVHSLDISLKQKYSISAACRAALDNLKEKVDSENLTPRDTLQKRP